VRLSAWSRADALTLLKKHVFSVVKGVRKGGRCCFDFGRCFFDFGKCGKRRKIIIFDFGKAEKLFFPFSEFFGVYVWAFREESCNYGIRFFVFSKKLIFQNIVVGRGREREREREKRDR
jgi:hypothetical protein